MFSSSDLTYLTTSNSYLWVSNQLHQYHDIEHTHISAVLRYFHEFHQTAVLVYRIHSHAYSSTSWQLYYFGFDDANCAACSFCAASWSAIVIEVNFLPIRSCISRYLATHRSRHTASPLLSSDSLYFGGTHFFWQAADILQSNAHYGRNEVANKNKMNLRQKH